MNRRTLKRIQKLHNEGIGLEQSISLIINLSQFDFNNIEIAGDIIKLIHDHLIHPPKAMFATDGGLRMVDLNEELKDYKEMNQLISKIDKETQKEDKDDSNR